MTAPTMLAIESPRSAELALVAYGVASERMDRANRDIAEAKFQLGRLRDDLKAAEAEVVVNGGWEGWAISGSNKEARDAATAVALAHCPPYQAALLEIRERERGLSLMEADIEQASNEMRQYRLQLEYATTWNSRKAAAEGGPEFRRNGYDQR